MLNAIAPDGVQLADSYKERGIWNALTIHERRISMKKFAREDS